MTIVKEYEIPKSRLSFLEEKMYSLNKRAAKLGCAPIIFEILDERKEIISRPESLFFQGETIFRALQEVIVFVKVKITGETPKYQGWTFAATIQHLPPVGESKAYDIIRTVPGFETPSRFRNRGPVCDHCGHNRYRKDTFIVCHEDGTWKQVGRQCLKDFLGCQDPHILAEQAEWLVDTLSLLEDKDSSLYQGGTGSRCFSLESYLKWVSGVIRVRGWLSRTKAQDSGRTATADLVDQLFSPIPIKDARYRAQMEELFQQATPTPEDEELAAKAIEWAKQLEEQNDYLHNICAIAKAGIIDHSLMGYAASIIPTYQKYLDEERRKNQQQSTSAYFGTIGKREEMELVLEKLIPFDGLYPSFLHIFSNALGNKAVWFASNMTGLKVGERIRAKATVKGYNERDGVKQTVLTRVSIL